MANNLGSARPGPRLNPNGNLQIHIRIVRPIRKFLPAAALAVAAVDPARAQYTPPPSEPFAGFINEAIRESNTNLTSLDIGGSERLRFVNQSEFGIPGTPGAPAAPNNDFRGHGAA